MPVRIHLLRCAAGSPSLHRNGSLILDFSRDSLVIHRVPRNNLIIPIFCSAVNESLNHRPGFVKRALVEEMDCGLPAPQDPSSDPCAAAPCCIGSRSFRDDPCRLLEAGNRTVKSPEGTQQAAMPPNTTEQGPGDLSLTRPGGWLMVLGEGKLQSEIPVQTRLPASGNYAAAMR
jgi:hypothetical protein